ncbi:MAG: hypothetical protein HOQ22_18595 [Nocardioidaceae bacterium]|nr:hypothetical protein [Nocardioidaceae bacterium]
MSKRIATSIARDNRRQPRCRELGGAPPTFGSPAAATRCDLRRPERTAVTLSGLFGDAWFSCQVTAPAPTSPVETTRRTEQWCVRVATTLGARP